MNEEEIINGNEIIRKFMGVKITKISNISPNSVFWIAREGNLKPPYPTSFISEKDIKFNYHLSLDILIPVIEKIENILEKQYYVIISENNCEIKHRFNKTEGTIFINGSSKIESTWLAIIKFIEWYNKTL